MGIGKWQGPEKKTNMHFSSTPVTPIGLSSGVIDIASGFYHHCALLSSGKVKCWGENTDKVLGISDEGLPIVTVKGGYERACSPTPVEVPGIDNAKAIASGGNTTCVLTSDGSVKCWGAGVAEPEIIKGLENDIIGIAVSSDRQK